MSGSLFELKRILLLYLDYLVEKSRVQHGDQAIRRSPRLCVIVVMKTIYRAYHAMPQSTTEPKVPAKSSETATTATTLPSSGVGRSGSDILDTSDAHTGTGKRAESRLSAGARGLGAVTTSSPDLNVQGRDTELLAAGG